MRKMPDRFNFHVHNSPELIYTADLWVGDGEYRVTWDDATGRQGVFIDYNDALLYVLEGDWVVVDG